MGYRRSKSPWVIPLTGRNYLASLVSHDISILLVVIKLTSFIADLGVLSAVEVSYATLPGWKEPITSITSFDALPENCKKYIAFIEDFLGVPIEWIGVGPGRESMLKKEVK